MTVHYYLVTQNSLSITGAPTQGLALTVRVGSQRRWRQTKVNQSNLLEPISVTEKNRQMSIKDAQNWFY